MSPSVSSHLTSGSRARRGYDYHMYTCMDPDSAQFRNMPRILEFSHVGGDHKMWGY